MGNRSYKKTPSSITIINNPKKLKKPKRYKLFNESSIENKFKNLNDLKFLIYNYCNCYTSKIDKLQEIINYENNGQNVLFTHTFNHDDKLYDIKLLNLLIEYCLNYKNNFKIHKNVCEAIIDLPQQLNTDHDKKSMTLAKTFIEHLVNVKNNNYKEDFRNFNLELSQILCSTFLTREEENEIVKLYINYINLKQFYTSCYCISSKIMINISQPVFTIDDLFISSIEALSVNTSRSILNYLLKNDFNNCMQKRNKLFPKHYFWGNNRDIVTERALSIVGSSIESLSNEQENETLDINYDDYLTILDSFVHKYMNKIIIFLSNKYEAQKEIDFKTQLNELLEIIYDLVKFGFKLNKLPNHSSYKTWVSYVELYTNILFLSYFNIQDICVKKSKKRTNDFNIETSLNNYLKILLNTVKLKGFKSNSDLNKLILYKKLKTCAFQNWNDENNESINQLVQSQTSQKTRVYQPLLLCEICRIQIRNRYGNYELNTLHLPRRIVNFLEYKHELLNDVDLYSQIAF